MFPEVVCMYGAPRPQTPSVVTVEPASVTDPAPADSEPGWGINFAHQSDTIFATWFTYGADGKP